MNSWQSRCVAASLMLLAIYGHGWATHQLPNTPVDMLLFHGSAALVDLLMLFSAPAVLNGRLCADTQKLLFASIVGNFAGWALYMAYVSPIFYNYGMLALTCVQLLRLFMPDRHVDYPRVHLVRDRDRIGGSDHP